MTHESISLPLSATESMLLTYCSSIIHEVSFILLEIPQEPTQFSLMAEDRENVAQSIASQ